MDGKSIFVSTSQSKWNKGRSIIFALIKDYVDWETNGCSGEPVLDFKSLEKDRGFMVHLAGTYPCIKPRLKGFHHSLDGWRGSRDNDGWKMRERKWEFVMDEGRRNAEHQHFADAQPSHGGSVRAVNRMRKDVLALGNLFKDIEPPLRLVRGKKIYIVKYGFGDASGTGFGASWLDPKGSISYRYGTWGDDAQIQSSNYRELRNLVDTLEHLSESNEMKGVEMFIFTDNSVAEAAFHKGNSSSKLLFELILRLTRMELTQKMKLHLIHVAGTRMIAQGADGLSRGNMLEGVMKGDSMLSFVPLNKSALEVQPELEDWIRSWLPSTNHIEILRPEDWFVKGHDIHGYTPNVDGVHVPIINTGTYIWSPPPAAADVAIQELRKARHKRHKSLHVFICPRLMKPLWFKQAYKAADMIFDLKAGHPYWQSDRHEPLIVAVCFPYLRHKPWQLRNSNLIHGVVRILRSLWEDPEESGVSVMRELCILARTMESMSPGMVRQMLQGRYKTELSYFSGRK